MKCQICNLQFFKELRRYNESIKFRWSFYCSRECFNRSKYTQQILRCSNPACIKEFSREQGDINPLGANFCSRTCANLINTKKYVRKSGRKLTNCVVCSKQFPGPNKCCSPACRKILLESLILTKEDILAQIRDFYSKYERIPLKIEFSHTKAARGLFGSWNKTILAAGFIPNPVKFAKKYKAQDGHMCDSFSERIIDDWLFKMQIPHKVHVRYADSKFLADFVIDEKIVEFIGLEGELENYDRSLKKKRELWKDRGIHVIEIYPKDLFPTNRLKLILGSLLK